MKFVDSTIPFFLSSNTLPPSAKQFALTTPFLFTLKFSKVDSSLKIHS